MMREGKDEGGHFQSCFCGLGVQSPLVWGGTKCLSAIHVFFKDPLFQNVLRGGAVYGINKAGADTVPTGCFIHVLLCLQ